MGWIREVREAFREGKVFFVILLESFCFDSFIDFDILLT